VHLYAYGLSKSDYTATMTHYVVKGEILNHIFSAPSIGETVYLPQQYKIKWWWYTYVWGAAKIEEARINNHGMDSVIDALKEDGYH
jgi:hypothetical protein